MNSPINSNNNNILIKKIYIKKQQKLINTLNTIGAVHVKDFIKLQDLQINKKYKVIKFLHCNNKFEEAKKNLIVELEEGLVNLPWRFAEQYATDEDLNDLNSVALMMLYQGAMGNTNLVQFIAYEE